jgi:Family of unknown function (DUF6152)
VRSFKSVMTVATLAALTMGLIAMPALAHHSFGRYDMAKSADIEGTVAKFEWSNPHCWLFVDVAAAGKTVTYGFEMASVGEMLRRGWTKTVLKQGDKVKITYHPLRDGTPAGLLMSAYKEGVLIGKPMPGPGQNGGPPPGGAPPPPGSPPAPVN